jgi:hypothetical protein
MSTCTRGRSEAIQMLLKGYRIVPTLKRCWLPKSLVRPAALKLSILNRLYAISPFSLVQEFILRLFEADHKLQLQYHFLLAQ